MNKIVSCILIGGKSSRIGGGIKSLKILNNKTILYKIIYRIKKQTNIIAINSNVKSKKLIQYNLPIFKDIYKGYQGPLAGIHASLFWTKKNFPSKKWVITIPGDSPFFPDDLIEKLYNKAKKENVKAVIAKSNNRIHSVFGLWHTSLESNLYYSIKNNVRKIDQWAKLHSLATVNFKNKNYDPFFNINYIEDLSKASKIDNQFFIK